MYSAVVDTDPLLDSVTQFSINIEVSMQVYSHSNAIVNVNGSENLANYG